MLSARQQPFCVGLYAWRVNSLWPSDAIRQHRSWSTLVQVMAWCRQAKPMLTYRKYGPVTFIPRGGTPYVMGDTYVPRFWPPFFTLAGSSTIFLGYFFSSTNSKAIFWGTKTTNFYKNRSFWPQIQFFPRSFWVQFSAASGTPPSVFRPSTPPPGVYLRATSQEIPQPSITKISFNLLHK